MNCFEDVVVGFFLIIIIIKFESLLWLQVLSTQTEAQGELLHQMLLFIVQNKTIGFAKTLKFLQPFLTFSVLKIPFSISSSAFARQLISSLAALSCSFPSEAVPIIKVAMGCLKYFPHRNVEVSALVFEVMYIS